MAFQPLTRIQIREIGSLLFINSWSVLFRWKVFLAMIYAVPQKASFYKLEMLMWLGILTTSFSISFFITPNYQVHCRHIVLKASDNFSALDTSSDQRNRTLFFVNSWRVLFRWKVFWGIYAVPHKAIFCNSRCWSVHKFYPHYFRHPSLSHPMSLSQQG